VEAAERAHIPTVDPHHRTTAKSTHLRPGRRDSDKECQPVRKKPLRSAGSRKLPSSRRARQRGQWASGTRMQCSVIPESHHQSLTLLPRRDHHLTRARGLRAWVGEMGEGAA
jgi:hypothetical protein